jgi:hypothetical protein
MIGQERTIDAHGDDVEAAIAAGLRTLGLQRDQVDIQVLDEYRPRDCPGDLGQDAGAGHHQRSFIRNGRRNRPANPHC